MKNQIVASIAVLPLALAGLSAGSAQAGTLTGSAAYSGIGAGMFSPVTSILASDGSIEFSDPDLVGLALQTGSFVDFGAATIYDIDPIPGTFDPSKLFLDFGADEAGLTDGKNIFKATSASEYVIASDGDSGSSISLAFNGYFYGDDETEVSKGYVNLDFTSMMSVADVEAILLEGGTGSIESTFSGMGVATVPEPATLLGLGLVGAALVGTRRRKNG